MMIRRMMMLLLLVTSIFLAGCAADNGNGDEGIGREISAAGGSYWDISVEELQEMLANKDFTMVNVHIPFEGDLPDTDISIPYNQIEQYLDQLPKEKDEKIVLYCRSDRMSGIAAEELVGLGYTNIYNLDGGFNAWVRAGLPMAGEQ